MKPGDLVIDKKHNYQHGIVIAVLDSSLFGGNESIYRVLLAGSTTTTYILESNLKKANK